MVNNNAGKGDTYRKVDMKKYDDNYMRIFRQKCPKCNGEGSVSYYSDNGTFIRKTICHSCRGSGYVNKNRKGV